MESNKRNVVISSTDKEYAECVEMQSYGQDGTVTSENLQLSGGENKKCIVGSVDLKNLAAATEVSPKNVDECEVTLCGEVSGDVSGYTVYSIDGEAVATGEISVNENGEAEISIPVQQLENDTGSAEFGIELNGTGVMNVTQSYATMSVTSSSGSGAINLDHYSGIGVTKNPDKVSYTAGEYFNKSGMEVILIPAIGYEERVIANYKISPTEPLKATDRYITISYDVLSTQIPIYVEDETVYADNSKSSAEHGENLKVNLATGRLLYVNEDLSVGANSYKISVSHVYNSKLYNSLSNYFGGMPRGWKLNAHQCLINEGNKKYTYIDAAGYMHHFTVAAYDHGTDEEGQGLILTVGSGKYIKDGQGNRLEFDADGRLVKSISGQNSAIRKVYSYSGNLLTKIYDSRKSSVAIELVYKNGLLNGIHAVENGYYKKSVVFEYTSDNLLQYKSIMSGTNKKRVLTFDYTDNKLLKTILNNDGTQACITYNDFRRVTKIDSGYLSGSTYTQKASITYNYLSSSNYNVYAYGNEITNDDGIKFAYFFNGKGEALSSFEKTSNGLVTLQKEQGEAISHTNGTTGINGFSAKSVSGSSGLTLCTDEHDLSKYGTSTQNFALSFWTRHHWNDANARIKFTYDAVKNGKTSTYTAYADIDGSAYGAWQYVSIPFNTDCAEKIKNLKLSVTKSGTTSSFSVSDYRIAPATKSSILIDGDSIDLMDIKYIMLTGESNRQITCGTDYRTEDYLTYNDIYKTLLNMAHNKEGDYFDFIYSNGTKMQSGVSRVEITVKGGNSYTLSLDATGKANVVAVTRSADNNSVTYNYITFGANNIASSVKNKDGSDYLLSQIEQVVSYSGNVISETDEYGARKDYTYNDYGDLLKTTLTGTDGKIITLQNNNYDSNNEYVTQSSSGYSGETYTYVKPFETLDKSVINDYNFINNTYTATQSALKYTYDAYGNNLTGVIATGGSGTAAANRITYANEKISTVSDGEGRYYFDSDNIKDTNIFGVYEYYNKIQQRKSVTNNKTKTNYYYRNKGIVTDTFENSYDKYGRLIDEYYNGEIKVQFDYNDGNRFSKFASSVSTVYDYYTGNYSYYDYDENGNLTGWNNDYLEVVNGATGKAYTFNDSEKYVTESIYDEDVVSSPRLKSTNVYAGSFSDKTQINSFSWDYDYIGAGLLNYKCSGGADYTYSYLTNNSRVLPLVSNCTFDCFGKINVSWDYDYDGTGNIKTVKETINGTEQTKTYAYDKFGRLTEEDGKKYVYNENGRMIRSGTDACSYDNRGRLVSFGTTTLEYDNYGNRTKKGSTVYNYTRGRLLESITGVASYTYDYQGVRYTKTVKDVTTTYHYDGNNIVGEDRSDGNELRYFYDAQGICGFRYKSAGIEANLIYVKNIHGDVEFLIDSSGIIYAQYEYDAWGNCTILVDVFGLGTLNPIRYRGYYYDSESKLYYLMTRYYDPETATFITRDSSKYIEPTMVGGLDLYAYCCNNPVMRCDPNGTDAWEDFWNQVAKVLGIIVGAATAFVVGTVVTMAAGPVFGIIAGLAAGTLAGALIAGLVNNIVNFVYYTFISDGVSNLTPTSYSGTEGDAVKYLSRWERLDYAKAMTGGSSYFGNGWRYYSEYSFHMYAWIATSSFYTGNRGDGLLSDFAYSAVGAEVDASSWDDRWYVNLFTIIFGIIGI